VHGQERRRDQQTATVSVPANGAVYPAGAAVLASYACADARSGVAGCSGPVANGAPIDTAGGGPRSFTVVATDNAGNTRTTSVSYSVADATPPVIVPSIVGTLGNNGWYTGNVSVTWSVSDPESAIGTQSGCGPAAITADTSAAGTTLTCSATSAGGTSSKSVTIRRDATLPAVTVTRPASGASYALNQDVTASFACSDALAGIATCSGTVANGSEIDTSSGGSKSFVVTAFDQAGNSTTKTVFYSVAGSPPVGSTAGTRLLAWNDLGMHCADSDFSVFTLLPPFNNVNAQLIVGGKLVSAGGASGYTLTYESAPDPATGSINTYSVGVPKKTNFWDYVTSLFGVSLPDNIGMTGNPTASTSPAPLTWSSEFGWWEVTGMPIVPVDDAQIVNPYPLVKVTAKNASGQTVATSHAVVPVSSEIDCVICHGSNTNPAARPPVKGWVNLAPGTERDWRMNVLRLHDEKNASPAYAALVAGKGYGASLESSVALANKPIFCDTCHNSNALAVWGLPGLAGVSNMTAAMHNRHADVVAPGTTQTLNSDGTRNACYNCHPGKSTQCLRGAMGNATDAAGKHTMECQSCHGSMRTVGNATRNGWFDMPTCQSCHHDGQRETVAINADGTFKIWSDKRFASNDDTPVAGVSLYRFSTGHGKLQCEACHNSTHAEFTDKPSATGNQVNDNLRAIEVQGYAASIRECTACHASMPSTTSGGPHGMHDISASWVTRHHDVVTNANNGACLYCHGTTSAGSPLAVVKVAKSFYIGDGRTKAFAANERVTCWSCHNGPQH